MKLPLGLHHPLHPIHPLILSSYQIDYGKDIQFSNCVLCNESRNQYTYWCFRCDFNLHFTLASLAPTAMEDAEFHHHPLTPFLKSFTFTCDLCGKKGKGTPYLCHLCSSWVHGRCASFPRIIKVLRHKHLLHLTHFSLEFHQSDSRFCQIYVQKVDTHYGFYYCSRCDFVTHLNCAMDRRNKEDTNLQEFKDVDHRWVFFKYERLPNFCYICGKLGHGRKECKESGLPNGGKGEVAYQYGAWLRGKPGKQVLNNSNHCGNDNFNHPSHPSKFRQNHWTQ